jgi:hypothetical protein
MTTTINGSSPSITFSDATTQTTAFTTTPIINTITSAASTALTLQSAGTTAMTIDTSQNVGIGTSSPAYKLDVNGNGRISGTLIVTGDISQSGSNVITNTNSSLYLQTSTAQPVIFRTNSTEAMRIDSSGNLLVGTTSNLGSSKVLISSATSTSYQLSIASSNSNGAEIAFYEGTTLGSVIGGITAVSTAYFQARCGSTGGVQLANAGTSWSSASDERLKNVTGTYDNALADIAQIKPVKFTWKSDAKNKPQVGVLAQSVFSVVPEAVDLDTRVSNEDKTDYMSVRYTELIPLLVASIKELNAKVESLTTRLTALEAK